MKYYEVSPFAITHASESVLTYSSSDNLLPGQIVSVEVGRRTVQAVVLKSVPEPSFVTKPIIAIVESTPLPEALLKLHHWLSRYYATHPVLVWRTMLPSGLGKKRRSLKPAQPLAERKQEKIDLNHDQTNAVSTIMSQSSGTHLLHGITGSGKTAVYIELARQTLEAGKSVIILTPEIALTSQLLADFKPHFPDIKVTHSTMTASARHQVWQSVLRSDQPQIVIGPRSALFMPVSNLGLIVIDECHEPAYKQEQSPLYSALRAASMLSQYAKARLVLGSATPSVVDYYLAKSENAVLELPQSARHDTVAPTVSLVDMTKPHNFTRSKFLSTTLLKQLTETIAAGHQALIFHNRRGTAPITLCEKCGWSATCPRCFIPLTLHSDQYKLRCHLCNYTERIPTSCPGCRSADIIHKGIGTKRIEEELRRFFGDATIARFDGDNTNRVEQDYQALYDGKIDIIIGTQVVAKGLDLPNLRFVGVVQADSGLALPDYQSSERVFQLLSQVAGRVGRNEHPSQVVIQSYQPDHPSVAFGISQNYQEFYDWCVTERKRANFPPFRHLLRLTAVYKTEAGAIRAARNLMAKLRSELPDSVEILGPAPSFYERLRDTYRWQITLKSTKRADLLKVVELLPPQGWRADLDPINLL